MIWTLVVFAALVLAAVAVVRSEGKSELAWAVALLAIYLLVNLLGFRL